MSILSSNNAQFKINLEYMKKRGYVWYELLEGGTIFLFYKRMYSRHKIYGWWDQDRKRLDEMWVSFPGYPRKNIKTIEDLDKLEEIWGEGNQKRKMKLKQKFLHK